MREHGDAHVVAQLMIGEGEQRMERETDGREQVGVTGEAEAGHKDGGGGVGQGERGGGERCGAWAAAVTGGGARERG